MLKIVGKLELLMNTETFCHNYCINLCPPEKCLAWFRTVRIVKSLGTFVTETQALEAAVKLYREATCFARQKRIGPHHLSTGDQNRGR